MSDAVAPFPTKEERERKKYADLVMQKFHEMEAADKGERHRATVEAKTEAHFNAKTRF